MLKATITTTIPPEVRDWIKSLARDNNTSVSKEAEKVLVEAYAKRSNVDCSLGESDEPEAQAQEQAPW